MSWQATFRPSTRPMWPFRKPNAGYSRKESRSGSIWRVNCTTRSFRIFWASTTSSKVLRRSTNFLKFSSVSWAKSARASGSLSSTCDKSAGLCVLPPLIASGWAPAIQSFTHDWAERTGIKVALDVDPKLGRLPEATELSIFRIVQEGLNNVWRHAKTSSVQISLQRPRHTLCWFPSRMMG